jgi:hypothetical protein
MNNGCSVVDWSSMATDTMPAAGARTCAGSRCAMCILEVSLVCEGIGKDGPKPKLATSSAELTTGGATEPPASNSVRCMRESLASIFDMCNYGYGHVMRRANATVPQLPGLKVDKKSGATAATGSLAGSTSDSAHCSFPVSCRQSFLQNTKYLSIEHHTHKTVICDVV